MLPGAVARASAGRPMVRPVVRLDRRPGTGWRPLTPVQRRSYSPFPVWKRCSTSAFQGSDNVGIFPYNGISPFGFNGAFYYSKVSFKF